MITFSRSFKYYLIFWGLLVALSCNKEVIDLEDGNGIVKLDSVSDTNIIISKTKPKGMDVYNYNYPEDSLRFNHVGFNFDQMTNNLNSIISGVSVFYNFFYFKDSIILASLAGDSSFAILKNNKITKMPGYWITYYEYDSSGNLFRRYNSYDSITYSYENGNLKEQIEYQSILGPTIKTEYEYYDSLKILSNACFFPFKGYESSSTVAVGSDGLFRFLDIFGASNNNLIKSATITNSQNNIPIKFDYTWSIQDSLIHILRISAYGTTTRKFVYSY
jgi:hypothetical protein